MNDEKILVIEDEADVRELLKFNLESRGYDVETCSDGRMALEAARRNHPDLILLDLMLPGVDGFTICKRIKGETDTASIKVIMLTARDDENDIVKGLELGADDYITKPFSPKILMARINTVLRRPGRTTAAGDDSGIIIAHEINIDTKRYIVTVGEENIKLTSTEFRMLTFLAARPGWVFTRYQIVDAVHGADYPVTDRSVDVQIVGLRKKLGDAGKYIETVRGVGYRFTE
ncbi:MAG: response regulator [Phycisphaerae bacterium]|jgi:two-component system phosphate regulon response regulator PhoB